MKTKRSWSVLLVLALGLLAAACGPSEEELAASVQSEVAAGRAQDATATPYPTATALPTLTPYPTQTPYPTYTPLPTGTAYPPAAAWLPDMANTFCQYSFCIGLPEGVYWSDLIPGAKYDPYVRSDYENGRLRNIDLRTLVFLGWELISSARWDALYDIELLTGSLQGIDASIQPTGDVVVETIGSQEITYQLLKTGSASFFDGGGVASWYCGNRAFFMTILGPSEGGTKNVLNDMLGLFSCVEE